MISLFLTETICKSTVFKKVTTECNVIYYYYYEGYDKCDCVIYVSMI